MGKANLAAMRLEYKGLMLVADGLDGIVRHCAACNMATLSRMAAEARLAARRLASQIEQAVLDAQRPVARFASWLDSARDAMGRCLTHLAEVALTFAGV